jgi:hypothetical protein
MIVNISRFHNVIAIAIELTPERKLTYTTVDSLSTQIEHERDLRAMTPADVFAYVLSEIT